MNRYFFLRRLRGPAMLLTFGVTALLDQWGGLSFGQSWPLYLIVFGVLRLAENAALWAGPAPAAAWAPGVVAPVSPTPYAPSSSLSIRPTSPEERS